MAAGHHDTFHHVRDFPYFETSESLGLGVDIVEGGHKVAFGIPLPEIPFLPAPHKIWLATQGELPPTDNIWGLQITKFMVLQLIAFVMALLIFRGLARRLQNGEPATGRWWNFWEMLALFIRDEVVRPTIGSGHHDHGEHTHQELAELEERAADDESEPMRSAVAMPHGKLGSHPADKYLPFVWSCFFFVLFCNLLGAIPWMGSPTGEINVTGALALVAFGAVVMYGTRERGVVGFWTNLVPPMDLPGPLKIVLVPMIWLIELMGLLIKHGVLAVRLFANIMAGHTVIAVILGFIAAASGSWLYYLVLPSSILGQVAIGMLELFVAVLQAYIFAFLTTLFIGAAIHEH